MTKKELNNRLDEIMPEYQSCMDFNVWVKKLIQQRAMQDAVSNPAKYSLTEADVPDLKKRLKEIDKEMSMAFPEERNHNQVAIEYTLDVYNDIIKTECSKQLEADQQPFEFGARWMLTYLVETGVIKP